MSLLPESAVEGILLIVGVSMGILFALLKGNILKADYFASDSETTT